MAIKKALWVEDKIAMMMDHQTRLHLETQRHNAKLHDRVLYAMLETDERRRCRYRLEILGLGAGWLVAQTGVVLGALAITGGLG